MLPCCSESVRRMSSRSKRSRASCRVSFPAADNSTLAGAPLTRSRNDRSAIEIESPGTMIIRRSMTFRSSRTLPGHAYRCIRPAASVFAAELRQKMIGEERNVLLPLAQRGHENRDDVQPEVQVLAELPGSNF